MTETSYANAREVLPAKLLAAVQRHFEGGMLWVPKRLGRGDTEQNLARDEKIARSARQGMTLSALAKSYGLSAERIRQIVREGTERSGRKSSADGGT